MIKLKQIEMDKRQPFDGTVIFFTEAKRLMKQFNLQSFKQSHPTLLKAIKNSLTIVHDGQQERLRNVIIEASDAFEKLKENHEKICEAYEERIKELENQINGTSKSISTETETVHAGE